MSRDREGFWGFSRRNGGRFDEHGWLESEEMDDQIIDLTEEDGLPYFDDESMADDFDEPEIVHPSFSEYEHADKEFGNWHADGCPQSGFRGGGSTRSHRYRERENFGRSFGFQYERPEDWPAPRALNPSIVFELLEQVRDLRMRQNDRPDPIPRRTTTISVEEMPDDTEPGTSPPGHRPPEIEENHDRPPSYDAHGPNKITTLPNSPMRSDSTIRPSCPSNRSLSPAPPCASRRDRHRYPDERHRYRSRSPHGRRRVKREVVEEELRRIKEDVVQLRVQATSLGGEVRCLRKELTETGKAVEETRRLLRKGQGSSWGPGCFS
ncbi:hypothetical protein P152DRAFT_119093 [Eremomyces bilateralis CBS 781.70]|uniref:Uncharacterized protein n=1 Tax=Eremomyces bilateralis CBS 781.70 TaxID=1392243 RepID=A0A6G1GEM4_9PEZI|nr:uncharacterized protein P152DRAFT_119093 [Eremomyces bilateralis CBS 781.70]KAF1816320.1 hypothetical protein P152DRAFT_119093 [Eremomyces bilateralis CBS 781.70]